MEQGTRNKCNPCSFDDQIVDSVGFCVECIEYLCKDCLTYHRKIKTTRRHTILKGGDIPANAASFKLLGETVACPNHRESEIEYNCRTHDEMVCVDCARRKHRACELEEIVDLLDEETDKENAEMLLKHAVELRNQTIFSKRRKETNIKRLLRNKIEIGNASTEYIQQIQEQLQKRCEQLERGKNDVVEREIQSKEEVVDESVKIEKELMQQSDLLKTAVDHGSPLQINVVLERISNNVKEHQQNVDLLSKQRKSSVIFKPNVRYLDIASLGTVETINTVIRSNETFDESNFDNGSNSEEPTSNNEVSHVVIKSHDKQSSSQVNSSFQKCTVEKQRASTQTLSDSKIAKENSREGNQSSLLERQLGQVETCNIRGVNDDMVCNMYGCVFLPNGHVVCIDKSNKNIKAFDQHWSLLSEHKLAGTPFGICCVNEHTIVITYSNWKRIDRFKVGNKMIEASGGFDTRYYGRGIAQHGNKYNIAIIMVDGELIIEIRDSRDGHVLRVIDNFKDPQGNKLSFKKPRDIVCRGKELIIGEQGHLWCVDTKGVISWFIIHDGKQEAQISTFTTDNEGNIYTCDYRNGKVYQVCSDDFVRIREIMSNVKEASCIAYNTRLEKLVIGCLNDDSIYMIKFLKT